MENVERRRRQLEENVSKLRQSLKHWQTWEFEYEMLKEEIQSAGSPSPSQMVDIGRDMGGSLVNEKEIQELLGKDQTKRSANQVVDMISRRVDYVQQNITTVEKQLDTAEKTLSATSMLLEPDTKNEEGLPLMDIEEELDEEGNVIQSSVLEPGKATPEIVEALRKAGVKKAEQEAAAVPHNQNKETSSAASASTSNKNPSSENHSTSLSTDHESPTPRPNPLRKSVSFSEDTKPDSSAKKLSSLEATGYNEALADYNFTKGTKVIEVDDYDNEVASYPIIPQGESSEDAALRRKMLQYGLSEVGQVVAEINLDRRDQEYSDEEMDDDDYNEYDSDESEEEDQYGRSTRREVTDEYRQQMIELEKSLNARMLENVGPQTGEQPLSAYSDDVRRLKVRKDETFDQPMITLEDATTEAAPRKKGVRFADTLDTSSPPRPSKGMTEAVQPAPPSTHTISDIIVERTEADPPPLAAASSKPAKVSRFKSSRAAATSHQPNQLPPRPLPAPQAFPEGPNGRTIANTIVEHDTEPFEGHAPDELDPALVNREVQQQYHKMRNKMIQQQGGFKSPEDDEEGQLMEEVDGKVKKVSRFRAARLKSGGV